MLRNGRASSSIAHPSGAPLSPLPVRREDVILVRHSRVARESAIDRTRLVGNERVGRTVVIEHGIGPALRVRIFLAVLLDQEDILQHARDTHREGRLGVNLLFRLIAASSLLRPIRQHVRLWSYWTMVSNRGVPREIGSARTSGVGFRSGPEGEH